MLLYISALRCFRLQRFSSVRREAAASNEVFSMGCLWLECGHCFGLSGLIALIMVPAKTGWLMDATGAAAPF